MFADLSSSLGQRQIENLQGEAARRGISLDELLIEICKKEADRLWHVARCQPKPQSEKRPVGRPRLSDAERRARELAKGPKRPVGRPPLTTEQLEAREKGGRLLNILDKQVVKEFLGERFHELYQRVQAAMDSGDLPTLSLIYEERAWTKKW